MIAPVDPEDLWARSLRAWRIFLVAYLVPVTIVTHWPRLGFEGAGTIDKVVHFVGFGMVAWIAMHARPFGRAWLGFLFGVAWVYIDEITQAIPILGRTFSGYYMIAGWIGVAVAGAIGWLRSRRVERSAARLLDGAMYGSPQRWLQAGFIVVAVIVVVGGVLYAREAMRLDKLSIPAAIHPLVQSGLLGIMLATYLVELHARAQLGAALFPAPVGPRAGRSVVVAVALHLGAILAGIFVSLVAYEGILRALFGVAPAEAHLVDHAGFLVLRSTFVLAGAALAFEALRTVRAYAERRAHPARLALP